MGSCSTQSNDLEEVSSLPKCSFEASLGLDSSSEEENAETRWNDSIEQASGDFASLSNISGLPQNEDSGMETPLCESPREEEQVVDAICRRTRAHYSLADMSLDELETFLQESDEEDYFQNVDDEEEYRKFVAAVQGNWKEGSGVDDGDGDRHGDAEDDDDDEEDDYDFEIELEEALESDYEELPKQEISKRKRRRCAAELGHKLKKTMPMERPLGSARIPLRPLLPSIACNKDSSSNGSMLLQEKVSHNGKLEPCGFTPCQRGQLQCLMQEHVQLLVQVFALTVLDPSKQQIATDTHKLLLQLADTREQVLKWKKLVLPEVCCCPRHAHSSTSPNSQPLIRVDSFHPRSPHQFASKQVPQKEASCHATCGLEKEAGSNSRLPPNLEAAVPNEGASKQTYAGTCADINQQCLSSTTTKVQSLLDVTPLTLVKDFLIDVAKGVEDFRQQHIQSKSDSTDHVQVPLFPAPVIQVLPAQACQRKKTMAGSLVEDTKLNGIALVPPEISAAVNRFTALFCPDLFPHKPPPAALAKRLLFTDAEDELLALGLLKYNTNWEKIQQHLLPPKTTHQIFVRQKNRSSSRAPENSIKTVRRLKTSPLTEAEEACVEEGLKFFRSDWLKVWEHCVPYRDPTTLSRLWRAAVGLQKSYNFSEEAKEKHRIKEKLRRQKQALLKEQHGNAEGELNSGDEACEEATGAYLHEAFLTDWNSQQSSSPAHLPEASCEFRSVEPGHCTNTSQATVVVHNSLTSMPNISVTQAKYVPIMNNSSFFSAPMSGTFDTTSSKASKRSSKKFWSNRGLQIIKLAPGLPSLNLPRCVRVISQAKFNNQFSTTSNAPVFPGPKFSSHSQKGGSIASLSGSSCGSMAPAGLSPDNLAGSSQHPHLHGKGVSLPAPAKMHPLLMQTTFEMGQLGSATSNKNSSHHPAFPGLPQNVPRFRPFLSASKGKMVVKSQVVMTSTERSTRDAAELHPFLQEEAEHHGGSLNITRIMTDPTSSVSKSPHAVVADRDILLKGHTHWPFILSDSVIRPEPRRAVQMHDIHEECVGSTLRKRKGRHSVSSPIGSKKGSKKTWSKSIHSDDADKSGMQTVEEKENGSSLVNFGEGDNIIMEQEELSGSDEETEELVQFEYEEISDSDKEGSECRSHAANVHKGDEGIEFEEEEIGSDDCDSDGGI